MINLKKKFSQKNPEWKNKRLGTCQYTTIGSDGCLISCLAMVGQYYGYKDTPETINEKIKKWNGYANGCLYIWGTVEKFYRKIKEKKVRTNYKLTNSDMESLYLSIDKGYPVMLWIDYNYKTAKNDMHWVLAVDYDKKDENNITVVDPINGQTVSLKKYLGGVVPNARRTIEAMVFYSGDVPVGGIKVKAEALTKAEAIIAEIRKVLNKYL